MDRGVALFDLDRTLLDGDSDLLWSELLGAEGALDVERVRAFHREYHAGTLDIDAFLRFQLAPLAAEDEARLAAWRAEWMERCIRPRLSAAARALVRQHAERGHACALVTATNAFLTTPIAAELGIPHLIATEPERVAGRYTGRVAGVPCFREGKLAKVGEWLARLGPGWAGLRESWFYSDSHNDLPLLARVTHPVCVDPDARLRAVARTLGWRILELARRETGAAASASSAIPAAGA